MKPIPCIHPVRKKLDSAVELPDYYGPGLAGLRMSDGKVFPKGKVQILTTGAPAQAQGLSDMQVKYGTT